MTGSTRAVTDLVDIESNKEAPPGAGDDHRQARIPRINVTTHGTEMETTSCKCDGPRHRHGDHGAMSVHRLGICVLQEGRDVRPIQDALGGLDLSSDDEGMWVIMIYHLAALL